MAESSVHTQVRADTKALLRDLTGTQLHLISVDMAQLHQGLVEKDMLPDLQKKLSSWIRVVVDARKVLKEEARG